MAKQGTLQDEKPKKSLSSTRLKLWLFSTKLHLRLKGSLSRNILRVICSYIRMTPSLAFLRGDGLRVRTLSLDTMMLRDVPELTVMEHSFCMVDLETAFYLAGNASLANSPHLLFIESQTTYALPPMREARLRPGVTCLSKHIYIFAGETDTCEELSLRTRHWTEIASLPYAVTRISTCTHLDKVYLAPASRYCLHVFSTLENCFESFKINKPLSGRLLSFDDNELLFLQGDMEAYRIPLRGQHARVPSIAISISRSFSGWKYLRPVPKGGLMCVGLIECLGNVYLLVQCGGMHSLATFEKESKTVVFRDVLK